MSSSSSRLGRKSARLRRDLGQGGGGLARGSMRRPGWRPRINPGEGAFYGPKLELLCAMPSAANGNAARLQVDFDLPNGSTRFISAPDGQKKTPVMLHRAMFGSLERFIGILIEHHAGHLPLWLSPVQAVVATITKDGRRLCL